MNELVPEVGAELTTRGRTITEADLVSFSALTGDWHPQHADAEWAANGRFGERVAHGMLVLSYALGLMPFDPERVVALRGLDSVTFKRPVRIGDTIRVRSRVERVRELDDEHSLVALALAGIRTRTAGPSPGPASRRCGARRRRRAAELNGDRARTRRSSSASGCCCDPRGKKRIVVTGVVNRHSIAYAIAERAQRQGAEVVLTSFGRVRRMTERAAKKLPEPVEVLELDVNSDEDLAALTAGAPRALGARRRGRARDRPRAARRARRRVPLRAARERPQRRSRPAPTR